MACNCGKNRPRVNGPKNPSIVAQANQTNFTLKVNNTPRPNVQSQQVRAQSETPQVRVQVNGETVLQSTENLSPAGLDAHKRRVEALRRQAIRNAFNR